MSKKRIRLQKALIYEEEDIIIVKFMTQSRIEINDVPDVIQVVKELESERIRGLLLDVRELEYISSEARKNFAQQTSDYIIANALLIKSPIQQTLANLYFKFASPVIDTKMFVSEYEAKLWLQTKVQMG